MPMLPALLAPVTLLASVLGGDAGDVAPQPAREVPESTQAGPDVTAGISDWLGIADMRRVPGARQVRIESRVILRIVPRPAPSSSDLLDEFSPAQVRIVERPAKRCLAMRDIAGVADRGDRLMLFLRDNRVLVASLERTCSPRDFYRGFYLEKSEDGMMCAGRDRLMSRSGASCQLQGMRELVEVIDRR